MPDVRFLQIHTLHGYPAALLNRDDSGLAKRISYGGSMRTRISSQCLKRHWRKAECAHALQKIDGATASVRSRETVTRRVIAPLEQAGHDAEAIKKIASEFQKAVYGDEKGDKTRQPLLLGEPEIAHLADEARKIAQKYGHDAEAASKAAADWRKDAKANMKALRENCALPGGIAAALFGRMVTSDVEANVDAAIHVAHAFTVHEEESESDYFTVVDDLQRAEDDSGADHIGETELTCGLFYGYVVVDRATLIGNLGPNAETAGEMAGEVAARLVHLIATVSPGAKLGSTAPYEYAAWILIEAGDRQPRSLAEAFRQRCAAAPRTVAQKTARDHLAKMDAMYDTGEARRLTSLDDVDMPRATRLASIDEIAAWTRGVIRSGDA